MKTTRPLVSIVIPSYNQGYFIEQTITSLINQRMDDLEIIILDGGSTDKTVDVIKRYESQISYWESKPDKGQSDAINRGFKMARGKYVNWLCSDDVLLPGSLRLMSNFLEKQPHIDIVFGNSEIIDSKGGFIAKRNEIPFDFKTVLYAFNYCLQPSALFRKSCLDKAGYCRVDMSYSMDHELWLRFHNHGCKFGFINECLSKYRYHPASKGTAESMLVYNQIRRDLKHEYGFRCTPAILESVVYPLLEAVFRLRRKGLQLRMHKELSLIPLSTRIARLNRTGKL